MGLEADLKSAFQDTLDNAGTSDDLATAITAAYEKSAKKAQDANKNTYSPISFAPLESALKASFALCLNAKVIPLDLTFASLSLVAVWLGAQITMPAKPPTPMTIVSTGLTLIPGFPLPVPPISGESEDLDAIVSTFLKMFENHAKTLTFNLVGFGPPSPAGPVPIPAFPVPGGVTLK